MSRMLSSSLCLCLICFGYVSMVTEYTIVAPSLTSVRHFSIAKNPSRGVIRLGTGWKTISVSHCAIECIKRYDMCMSFMFNSATGMCTPGSVFSDSESLPSFAEGELYHSGCDTSKGFHIKTYNGTKACVGKFGPLLNYHDADIACRSIGSFLASAKTMEKLFLLHQLLLPDAEERIWVGCDDLEEKGVYVWKEDGETFTNETKPDTMSNGQPDSWHDIEHCFIIAPQSRANRLLNDYYCDGGLNYLCEISL